MLPGVVTLIDRCVRMMVPNFTKKGSFQHYVREHKVYAKFLKRGWFPGRVLEIWKKGWKFSMSVYSKFEKRGENIFWACTRKCEFLSVLDLVEKGVCQQKCTWNAKKGGFFRAKLYLFSCKIGVKISENVLETTRKRGEISENVLETARKRGAILSCGTIMCYTFQ